MTSVRSKQDVDAAIFADFIVESIEKFNEFRKLGKAHTKNQIRIRGINDTFIPSDDKEGTQFYGYFSVVNFRQTTFREVSPNMDGAIRAKAQTYGMAMLSILSGRHTPKLLNYHTRGIMCDMELNCLQSSGGVVNAGNMSIFDTRIEEGFYNSFIKGFERDENLNHLLVRFTKHTLTTKFFGENGICLGSPSAFHANYATAMTQAQAQT